MSGTATVSVADLRSIDLFDELDDERLAVWAAAAEPLEAEAGAVIHEQGSPPRGLLLLLDGVAEALLQGDGGRPEPMGLHHAPTWMGAIAALTESPLGVRMQAETACRLALVPTQRFLVLALEDRPVHRRIMRQIAPVMSRVTAIEQSRERLTALGTMAAGLAHELNNPAAAAKRAASELVDALDVVSATIGAFVGSGIERADAAELVALQQEALDRAAGRGALEALDASDAEDEMLERLEALGVDEPWRLAEPLAVAGLDADWLAALAERAGPATEAALRWVAASLTARNLAGELLSSAERMSGLVGAVKTYAYMDRGALVEVDVHEGLETTLAVLAHKLKHTGIEVVRDYDRSLPRLTVRGSELNQVWTNLLDNAIDALGERGTLTVRTTRDGACLRVDVADDGPGILAEARDHVLEPFFTTKDVGRGTGLGLDTARRIVEERHRGALGFETGEGGTTFHVRLPLADTVR